MKRLFIALLWWFVAAGRLVCLFLCLFVFFVFLLCGRWHRPIMDALVRLPPLSPGDAVFYHTGEERVVCAREAKHRKGKEGERAMREEIREGKGREGRGREGKKDSRL